MSYRCLEDMRMLCKEEQLEGCEHGALTAELGVHLAEYTHTHRLGRVYSAGTGFKLTSSPDTMRAPDVAFVSAERLQQVTRSTGYFPGAPDLAVEIISPNDRHTEVEEKVEMWLEHGTKMVVTLSAPTLPRSPSNSNPTRILSA